MGINFFLLTGGEFAAKLLTFVAFTWLARTLGPDHYGVIEFTIAVMVFFTLPADLGLGAYGAREIAHNPGQASLLLAEIVQMRTILSAASFCLLMAFIAVIHKSAELKLLLGLYGLSLLLSAFMLQWFFQAHDQMHWVALASIVRQVVFAGLVLLLIRAHTDVVLIGLIECASVAAVGVLSLAVVKGRMRVPLPRLNLPFRHVARHLRGGVAIGTCELAWAFMWYFSTVLLGLAFDQHGYLGWFGASHRLLMAGHTFVWLYFFNLLPSLARTTSEKPSVLLRLMDRSVNFAVWSSLLVAFLGSALAGNVLTTVYGPQFLDAGGSFAVLIWMIPVAMLSGHYRYCSAGIQPAGQTALLHAVVGGAGGAGRFRAGTRIRLHRRGMGAADRKHIQSGSGVFRGPAIHHADPVPASSEPSAAGHWDCHCPVPAIFKSGRVDRLRNLGVRLRSCAGRYQRAAGYQPGSHAYPEQQTECAGSATGA